MATTISFNWELFHPSVRPEWLCGLKRQIPSVNSEAREHFHCFFPPNCSFKSFHHVSWHLLKLRPLSTLCFTTRGGKIWPPDISIPSAAGTLSSAFAASHFKSFKQKCGIFFFQSAASYVFRRKNVNCCTQISKPSTLLCPTTTRSCGMFSGS